MVRIRLQRLGRTNRPFYRISAMDKRARRDGRFIEQIGWYDPLAKDVSKQVGLNEERAKYWVSVGAQPSGTVRDILAKRNLVDRAAWESDRKDERSKMETRVAARKAAAAEGEKKPEAAAKPAEKPAEAKAE
ncbi:MAG: 30S ribosomal protein S16 [Phycisphaerales bacterium]